MRAGTPLFARSSRRAFTLLEVVATMAVIVIVALFVYRAAASSSTDTLAATARLSSSRVLAAEQNFAATAGTYTSSVDDLYGVGRDVTVSTAGSTGATEVSVALSREGTLVVAVLGGPQTCYVTVARSPLDGGHVTESVESGECTAAAYLPAGETPE